MASTASLEPTLIDAVASYEMALKGSTDTLLALQELSIYTETRAKKMIYLLIGRDVRRHTSTVWNDLVVARLMFDVTDNRGLALLTSGNSLLSEDVSKAHSQVCACFGRFSLYLFGYS